MTVFRRYYANGAPELTIAAQISDVDTSISCASYVGYPTTFPFYGVLDYGENSEEIVLVTAISGTTATITRGQGGTSAISHPAGATFNHGYVAQDADDANNHIMSETGVHGADGAVVGTTDVQTLTNKTLVSPDVTGTMAAEDVNISGNVAIGGTLNVTGTVVGGGATFDSVSTDTSTVNGNQTVGGNETVTGALTAGSVSTAGAVNGASGAFSGAVTSDSLTSDDITGSLHPKSYTNQAAAGTQAVGTIVHLTAPTGGYVAGNFQSTGTDWIPVAGDNAIQLLDNTSPLTGTTAMPALMQAGSVEVVTNGSAVATATFQSAFPNSVLAVVVTPMTDPDLDIRLVGAGLTTFQIFVRHSDGTSAPSTTLSISYIAIGS